MANYRGAKLCKAKGWKTENKTANVQMSWTTFRHNLAFTGSVQLLRQYLLPLLQLGLSLWPQELNKPHWLWSLGQCYLLHSSKTLLVERAERLNSFQNQWEELQRHLLLAIFLMQSFCSLRRHSTWGKSFSVLLITDFNHTASIVEISLTTTISHITSASVMLECWQHLSKPVRGYTRS